MTVDDVEDADVLRPFLGVKERRRSSFGKFALGDDLGIARDDECARSLAKHGVTKITFSARAMKINTRDECVKRIFVVTNVGVALLDSSTRKLRRKFSWKDVSEVRVSAYADDFFALIVPDEYDALLVCSRKTEAIVAMREMWKRDAIARAARAGVAPPRGELPVDASARFTYKAAAYRVRRVEFKRLENGDVDVDIVDVDVDAVTS